MSGKEDESLHHEFYTQERWNNWLNQVRESDFKLEESEEPQGAEGAIFVNMEDDIILACLKVIAKFDKEQISAESTLEILMDIRDMVLAEIEPISEDVDMMIASLQTSLMGGFAAFECYVGGDYDKTDKIAALVKKAIKAEESDDVEMVIDAIAHIGALVLSGKRLTEKTLEKVPYGLVAEWLDGIESISAAKVGADSYKNDEAYDGRL
ncbi:DUF2150 family protein [Methanolobus sp. ZRKC3]|uniref:DUF2150 family protein n=1 Tax=Methanolobus sp. ZRKC3 TaxID=3125786 RepID=UPI0032497CD3